MNTTSNARDEAILQEYFQNHYDRHLAEVRRRSTVGGRMEEAFEKSDGTVPDAFYRFFEGEVTASGICIVYMPDFGVNRRANRKGKIIIEIIYQNNSLMRAEDCFELQLAGKTRLQDVKLDCLEPRNINVDVSRYYNLFLGWDDAIPLVQRILFCPLFRQRFLMTTASENLGSITTQRFLSNMGQVLSFRSCVLNE